MTPLLFILIALGWAGVLWAWARERVATGSLAAGSSFPSLAGPRPDGPLAPPRNARMARRRRREVLATLAVLALSTFVLARAWSALWMLHLLVDASLIAFLWAVVTLERPELGSRPRLGPVVDVVPPRRPGPRPHAEPVAEPALR